MIDCGITPPRRRPPNQPDKIIRKLENFPELVEALRDGNQVRARLLFARLFDGDNDDRREIQPNS